MPGAAGFAVAGQGRAVVARDVSSRRLLPAPGLVAGAAAESVGHRLGARVFRSVAEVFASAQVDAVLVASATASHCDCIEAAVEAGRQVPCEKPLSLSMERIKQYRKRIGDTDLPVMPGFMRRFGPGHRAARQACLDGENGGLHQVIITSRDPAMSPDAYVEVSGGIFRDMSIHDLDPARFMLNEEVVSVSAGR